MLPESDKRDPYAPHGLILRYARHLKKVKDLRIGLPLRAIDSHYSAHGQFSNLGLDSLLKHC
jgi:hypothetical protein